mmetsp:Transcript_1560/g.3393  ORF Transcript_1560/g.3393 Transcript_1560/m.3393 type:complete len:421 (+) Transcript_1560:917-2179(+)
MSLFDRVQKLGHGSKHGDAERKSNLASCTSKDRKNHWVSRRRAENVTVDKLPASFFRRIIKAVHFIVDGNILSEGADHDGTNGSSQEQNNHERIDNAEVVEVVIGGSDKVDIPSVRPLEIRFGPFHFVRKCNGERSGSSHPKRHIVFRVIVDTTTVAGVKLGLFGNGRSVRGEFVVDRHGVNIKTRNADASKSRGIFMVCDDKLEMVEQVEFTRFEGFEGRRSLETKRVTANGVVVFLAAHQHRELIQSELDTVLSFHEAAHPTHFLAVEVDSTEGCTAKVGLDTNIGERSNLEIVTLETRTKVATFTATLSKLGFLRHGAGGQVIVFVGDGCFTRINKVSVDKDAFTRHVLFRGNTRKENFGNGRLAFAQQTLALLGTKLVSTESRGFGRVGDLVLTLSTLGKVDVALHRLDFSSFQSV